VRAPDDRLRAFLAGHGLISGEVHVSPLTGGVSSDIVVVRSGADAVAPVVVVKRALARLRVAADWAAPVERTRSEAAWLRIVAALLPGACPRVLAYDDDSGYLAMEYLDPATHPVWKASLLGGTVDPHVAGAVGDRLGAIHAGAAGDTALAARFDGGAMFEALRIEPYLRATGVRHPDLRRRLDGLAYGLADRRTTLVHGDVSPKNILVGPAGPVLLDAECAHWGDPAFDVAFCVNHLLLKCVARRERTDALLESAARLAGRYLRHVSWEPPAQLDARVAALLPALLLARVDGKSPVEYLAGGGRDLVRDAALALFADRPESIGEVVSAWRHTVT
jgi:aminoglycoside phosphotransferase (APT) family kinase protein